MSTLEEKFAGLGIDNKLQTEESVELRGEVLTGTPVNFCHGDVEAHEPPPDSLAVFEEGYRKGNQQAFSEFRGAEHIRRDVAEKLSEFTGAAIDAASGLILTPGTQGALFLAMSSLIERGDRTAIVEPDYFAYRELVTFLEGTAVPVRLDYYSREDRAGIDLEKLEEIFRSGIKVFVFSNPNNPTGAIYSFDEIVTIAKLAKKYKVALIVDELFARIVFDGNAFTHLCAQKEIPGNLITVIGPSKTEALSGFRIGAAFKNCIRINFSQEHDAAVEAIRRMGKLIERYQS